MGLDLGDKTIGIAISDPLGITAQGITVLRRESLKSDLARLRAIAHEWQIEEVVIGLPRNLNGSYGPRAEGVRAFAAALSSHLGLSVREWDERLSTVAAERALLEGDLTRRRRRQVVDQTAAAIILQGYLDRLTAQSPLGKMSYLGGNEVDTVRDEGDEVITLTDGDGKEHDFTVVDVIEVDGHEYAILLPLDELEAGDDDEGEAVIFRLEEDENGEEVLVDIEDDEEWDRVAAAYEQMCDDELAELDEDEEEEGGEH